MARSGILLGVTQEIPMIPTCHWIGRLIRKIYEEAVR
jgi:hypothetical protein